MWKRRISTVTSPLFLNSNRYPCHQSWRHQGKSFKEDIFRQSTAQTLKAPYNHLGKECIFRQNRLEMVTSRYVCIQHKHSKFLIQFDIFSFIIFLQIDICETFWFFREHNYRSSSSSESSQSQWGLTHGGGHSTTAGAGHFTLGSKSHWANNTEGPNKSSATTAVTTSSVLASRTPGSSLSKSLAKSSTGTT